MKTLSLICCLFLVAFGAYSCMIKHNAAGVALVILGSLFFLFIAPKTKKVEGYNPNHWMNR